MWQKITNIFTNPKAIVYTLSGVLITLPMGYFINTLSVILFVVTTIFCAKENGFKINRKLVPLVLIYLLMLVSVLWSIDRGATISALTKELSLLVIPIAFFMIPNLTKEQTRLIFRNYSYSMVFYGLFYLIIATIRYVIFEVTDVFFYHELVTKDVNAIYVSVFMSFAMFFFITKKSKKLLDKGIIIFLLMIVFLLSSKNIVVVDILLIISYYLFSIKTDLKTRIISIVFLTIGIIGLFYVGKIKERFLHENQSNIQEAWTCTDFGQNYYLPGTAFRVYQFRIFTEMLQEDPIFFTGYGLNASKPKIEAKTVQYNLHNGYGGFNFHNQYTQIFAELGVLGFLLLLLILFINLRKSIINKDFLHIAFAITMIILFLTESFLWRQRGVVFFTIIYCVFITTDVMSKKVILKRD
ncbi:O-antigen ligase family protein [Flavobacterium sp. '19STA2R22 D10 B1']|uniref:O-antigen ligase family protein n=1 Tax=Flavobacterium aerium TaxID=3037261 RepID=UPI00278BFE0F|nr:O-antigen ligase family protein [Flavobacterium sp. '19STA2R22 D10 B1']